MENDDKTRILRRPDGDNAPPPIPGGFGDDKTRIINRPPPPPGQSGGETTRMVGSQPADGDKTVILGPTTRRRTSASSPGAESAAPKDQMHDPVVGWMAVVAGPGAGDYVRLGYGMNSIGRGEDQRCRLNFGDEKISRQNHASITYDPRGRKFYLQHGGGQNLTYVGDVPVLQPTELTGGEFLVIGNTVLRFVPLCGPDFDYQDSPEQPQA
jgi:hypothetical protein